MQRNVALPDNGILFAVALDLRAGVFADDNLITGLNSHHNFLAVNVAAGADCNYLCDLRLFLRSTGEDDTALRRFLRFDHFYDDPVRKWCEFHKNFLLEMYVFVIKTNIKRSFRFVP